MKVAIVIDKEGTAIDRLARMTVRAADWHAYRIVPVHPKRPSEEQLNAFEQAMQWADVIDFRYWKSAEMLRAHYAIRKPCLLTHYNPYDLNQKQWSEYQANVVVNKEQQMILKHASTLVPLPIDLDYWEYQPHETDNHEFDLIMVANRIEGKKGILPVAKLAGEKGYRMALVGSVSDPNYMDEVLKAGNGNVKPFLKITDEDLMRLYHRSIIHVCNSQDNFESGTMPILEAMACGTVVLTRRVGHVPDLFNGRNMAVRKSTQDDTNELDAMIQELLKDPAYRLEMAQEARSSIRSRHLDIYARSYSKLYHKVRGPEALVSMVIPTAGDIANLMKVLAHAMSQTWADIEIIVCYDGTDPVPVRDVIREARSVTSHTIKFYDVTTYRLNPDNPLQLIKTYGLARARNKAILEAEGDWMMFVDDRIQVDAEALRAFLTRAKENTWLWGVKDASPKGFVENFSFIKRADIIRIGGFSEQITQYGGMTQEVRTRAEQNKIAFELVEAAKATAATKSRSRWTKYSAIAKSKSQCYKLYG